MIRQGSQITYEQVVIELTFEVTRVGHNDGASLFEEVKGGGHDGCSEEMW